MWSMEYTIWLPYRFIAKPKPYSKHTGSSWTVPTRSYVFRCFIAVNYCRVLKLPTLEYMEFTVL